MPSARFTVATDVAARAWLATHPAASPLVIAYHVHRCCGGGSICQAEVRGFSAGDRREDYATGTLDDGMEVLIDPRAARRLPGHFTLTVGGIGRFKHLDLALDAEQWGELLYT